MSGAMLTEQDVLDVIARATRPIGWSRVRKELLISKNKIYSGYRIKKCIANLLEVGAIELTRGKDMYKNDFDGYSVKEKQHASNG